MPTFRDIMTEAAQQTWHDRFSAEPFYLVELGKQLDQATNTPTRAKPFVEKFIALATAWEAIFEEGQERTSDGWPVENRQLLLGKLDACAAALNNMNNAASVNTFLKRFADNIATPLILLEQSIRVQLLELPTFQEVDLADLDALFEEDTSS